MPTFRNSRQTIKQKAGPVSQLETQTTVSQPIYSTFNFTPLSLNPALWLDASDTSTITESGGSVSQWNDKSSNAYHFTQGTGINQPTTGARTINALNTIEFDNSNDWMSAGDVLDLGTNSLSMFAVAVLDAPTAAGKVIIGKYKVTPAAGSYLMLHEASSQRNYYVSATSTFASLSYTSNLPFIQSGVADREAGTINIQLNRFSTASNTFTPDSGTNRNISTHLYLGALRNSGDTGFQSGYYWDGVIGEIILVPRALTFNEIRMTENYLRAKWNTL